ncbi:class II aldolase/adducin family protein [Candidatus Poriferisocius sp.]|uniref:class II aldolase/adducin family protein n=1 Tax=Candidatus Poriferisocius sp. TaxID=3101276 RepID=UPI003B01B83A
MTENTDIRAEVVRAAQAMDESGLVVGTAGNVSGRHTGGTIWLTPSSLPYDQVSIDNLAGVDLEGNLVAGVSRPSTEKAMHLACYRAFPEVGGVLHCHPVHASMFAVAHRSIPAVIEEVIIYLGGDVAVADYRPTGTDELGEEVVRHLADRSAVLMANHGMLCVGSSPNHALHAAQVAEHTARIVWGASRLSDPVELPTKARSDFAEVYSYLRTQTWATSARLLS